MIVAFHHPHNEGSVAGLVTGPGFDAGTALVDTYEVDAQIRSFDTIQEAREWLSETCHVDPQLLSEVPGGFLLITEEDYS